MNSKITDFEEYKKKLVKSSKKTSIKPGCKVSNIREKMQISKTKIALGLGLVGMCTSIIVSPIVAKKIKQNNALNTSLDEYQEDIVVPNTTFFINHNEVINHTAGHNHKEKEILEQLKEKHENHLVTFYLFYQSIMKDEQCRNHYKQVWMQVYNNVNNTDYTSLEDFLEKNNFGTYDELREYVALELQAENIREGR